VLHEFRDMKSLLSLISSNIAYEGTQHAELAPCASDPSRSFVDSQKARSPRLAPPLLDKTAAFNDALAHELWAMSLWDLCETWWRTRKRSGEIEREREGQGLIVGVELMFCEHQNLRDDVSLLRERIIHLSIMIIDHYYYHYHRHPLV